MRVLHVTFFRSAVRRRAPNQLALWPVLHDVLAALAARGHEVRALVSGHGDDETTAGHATVHFVADGAIALRLRRPARLIAAARAFRPEVVHVHGLGFPVQTWWLSGALDATPVVVQDHAGRPPHGALRRAAMRYGLHRARVFLFTAPEQATPFITAGALGPKVLTRQVIEGSCRFSPGDREHARAVTGMRGNPCVLWVGHLDANKDPLTALEALAQAARALPDLRAFFCFGSAPLEEDVRHRIERDALLRDRVVLLGTVPHTEIAARLQAADLFFLSSRREGGNLATVEALACGVVPVVTDLPSQRVIVGEVGGFFAPGDAAAASKLLIRLARGDRAALRARARRRFDTALSYDCIAERLDTIYREVALS